MVFLVLLQIDDSVLLAVCRKTGIAARDYYGELY